MAAMNIQANQLKEMIESGKSVLVDFWAPWCPHCRKINPAYEQIAKEYEGRVDVVKVDIDEDDRRGTDSDASFVCGWKERVVRCGAGIQGGNRRVPP